MNKLVHQRGDHILRTKGTGSVTIVKPHGNKNISKKCQKALKENIPKL